MRRFQLVWWGLPGTGFGFGRYSPDCGLGHVYRWYLCLGIIEIRRWANQ